MDCYSGSPAIAEYLMRRDLTDGKNFFARDSPPKADKPYALLVLLGDGSGVVIEWWSR